LFCVWQAAAAAALEAERDRCAELSRELRAEQLQREEVRFSLSSRSMRFPSRADVRAAACCSLCVPCLQSERALEEEKARFGKLLAVRRFVRNNSSPVEEPPASVGAGADADADDAAEAGDVGVVGAAGAFN
jgi:hypothetical protein